MRTYLCVLDYTEQALDAERRLRRGERQVFCAKCGLWRWPEECAHEGRLTETQFTAMAARVRRVVARDYPSQEARYQQEMRRLLRQPASGDTP